MSVVVQICIVVVTIAVVFVAYAATRVMLELRTTTRRFRSAYPQVMEILEDLRETSVRVRELTVRLDGISRTVQTGADRVEGLVDQAATIGTTVLDELERPVRHAVAVMRGVQSGIRVLTERWSSGREVDGPLNRRSAS